MRTSGLVAWLAALLVTGVAADQARVTVRVVEVPHRELTKWLEDPAVNGQELHDKAVKLALAGGAEIVETNVLTVRSGGKAVLESIAEMIYPTETEPSYLSSQSGGGLRPPPQFPLRIRPDNFTSWEIRNAGVTLEIEPVIAGNAEVIDLRLRLNMVEREALTTWTEFRDEWGDGSVRMPVFGSKQMRGSLTLADGVFELFNTFTPKPAAIPAATTRILVFVRADVLPTPIDE